MRDRYALYAQLYILEDVCKGPCKYLEHDLPERPVSVDAGLRIGWHTHRCWLQYSLVAILPCSVLAFLFNPDLGTNLVLELLILGGYKTQHTQ